MAQQPSGELPSTDATARTQDAAFQESWLSPEISLNSRSCLQQFQCSTSSHFGKHTPRLSSGGDERMARGSCRRLIMFEARNSRVLLSQCDNALPTHGPIASFVKTRTGA